MCPFPHITGTRGLTIYCQNARGKEECLGFVFCCCFGFFFLFFCISLLEKLDFFFNALGHLHFFHDNFFITMPFLFLL